VRSDQGSATLYLPDEQIVKDTATGAVSGTRYYAIGGVTVAARTSAGHVSYLTGDQQGTSTIAVDSTTLTATHRYFDPYGIRSGRCRMRGRGRGVRRRYRRPFPSGRGRTVGQGAARCRRPGSSLFSGLQ
jgi:hypothetical protein